MTSSDPDPTERLEWPHMRHRHGRWMHDGFPLKRDMDNRLLGGVASGIARRIGRDPTMVRAVFVIAGVFGFGIFVYLIGWLLLPAEGENEPIAARAAHDGSGLALAAAVASAALIVVASASAVGVGWAGSFGWACVAAGAGLVVVARNGSTAERDTLRRLAGPLLPIGADESKARVVLRFVGAAVLIAAGVRLLLDAHGHSSGLRYGGLACIVAGVVVLLVPWWRRVAHDLLVERQARARAEERADIAARLHDSVLQTLALIQRRANDPQQVRQLARAQERELRRWLFDGTVPGGVDADVSTLAGGVHRLTEEVESLHKVPVESVMVGDAQLDDALTALLGAMREAIVNAAKWSGAPVISVFVEVDGERVAAYVRDRGCGFDPAGVPADRKGLSESVTARMCRYGGSAQIRSTVGEGTEVALVMPRAAREREHATRR